MGQSRWNYKNIISSSMNDYLIIYNPISGQGIAKKNIKKIKNLFDNENKNYSIKKSQYKGHVTELCKCTENYNNIIIVGGDGTFNEAINGFMNNKSINSLSVGFIPGGTGNALMHDLNATSYETAVNIILKGKTKKMSRRAGLFGRRPTAPSLRV